MLDLIPMLETENIHETKEFYTEVLDFKLKGSHQNNGILTWIMLEWDRAGLMFSSRFEATKETQCQMTGSLYFYPEDVHSLWNQLKDLATIEWPLQTFHYGMTEFAILDNNGYRLIFGQ